MGVKSLKPNQKPLMKEVSSLIQPVNPHVYSILKYKTCLAPCNTFFYSGVGICESNRRKINVVNFFPSITVFRKVTLSFFAKVLS